MSSLFRFVPSVSVLALATSVPCQGTATRLADIYPGPTGSSPNAFLDGGDVFYFNATTPAGAGVYRSDGTTAGTSLVTYPGHTAAPQMQLFHQGKLFFLGTTAATGRELFVDIAGSATLVADLNPGPANADIRRLTAGPRGVVYFVGNFASTGAELWRTDGTLAGTALVKDINPGAGAGLAASTVGFAVLGDFLYFAANDGVSGVELWRSDGTAAGTTQVADLGPGSGGSSPGYLTSVGGRVYFAATVPGLGEEPYVTDGTTTTALGDLYPGAPGSVPNPSVGGIQFASAGSWVFFAATNGTLGVELWRTDGTPAGTSQVADLFPGFDGSFPNTLTPFGDVVLFQCDPGDFSSNVWRSDGTTAGTYRVNSQISCGLTPFAAQGNGRMVFSGGTFASSTEIARTDGTNAGTVLHQDLRSNGASFPRSFFPWRNLVLFIANDGTSGDEVWVMPLMASSYGYGLGCRGSSALPPSIRATGVSSLGSASFGVSLGNALPSAVSFLCLGFGATDVPIAGGCTLYVNPAPLLLVFGVLANGAGSATLLLPPPNDPALAGALLYFQYLTLDPLGGFSGLAFTSGLRTVLAQN